jgi:hypothetical protein
MTFAPPTLVTLGKYLVSQGAVNLGIVGDAAHVGTGTSYHLGKSALSPTAYSRQLPRDKAGLSEAASAIDIGKVGGSLKGLQALSSWLASQCQRRAIDTLDIREVIYSPDGSKVYRWDEPSQTVYPGGTGTGQGDDSHLYHTHVSWYRDAEFRDHTQVFRRYFEEEDVQYEYKAENWLLDAGPDRISSLGTPYKADGVTPDYNAGRLCLSATTPGGPYVLLLVARNRLTDPKAGLTEDFRVALTSYALPSPDCSDEIATIAALEARLAGVKAKVAAGATDIADD